MVEPICWPLCELIRVNFSNEWKPSNTFENSQKMRKRFRNCVFLSISRHGFKFGKCWGFPNDSRFAITNVNDNENHGQTWSGVAEGDPINHLLVLMWKLMDMDCKINGFLYAM
jgi:hypothetical protein